MPRETQRDSCIHPQTDGRAILFIRNRSPDFYHRGISPTAFLPAHPQGYISTFFPTPPANCFSFPRHRTPDLVFPVFSLLSDYFRVFFPSYSPQILLFSPLFSRPLFTIILRATQPLHSTPNSPLFSSPLSNGPSPPGAAGLDVAVLHSPAVATVGCGAERGGQGLAEDRGHDCLPDPSQQIPAAP